MVGENFLNLMSEMPKNALKLNIVNRQEIIKRLCQKNTKYQENIKKSRPMSKNQEKIKKIKKIKTCGHPDCSVVCFFI